MPAKSIAQQRLMQIAEHHPEKLYARNKGVAKMSQQDLHEFASGSEEGKPQHVAPRRKLKFPSPSKKKG